MNPKKLLRKSYVIFLIIFWGLWSFPQASTAEVFKPTAFTDDAGNTIYEELAFDVDEYKSTSADISTSEDAFPSITYHNWQTTSDEYSSLTLYVNRSSIGHIDDKWGIWYSTNDGNNWMSLDNWSSQNIGQSEISVDLDPSQDLSQLQVIIYTDRKKKADNGQVHIFDIRVEGEIGTNPSLEQSAYRFFEVSNSNGIYEKGSNIPGTDVAKAMSIDSSFMYVVGFELGEWRIEKRSLVDGTLDYQIISEDSWGEATSIAIDDDYMYVAGDDYTGDDYRWRIEKRLLSNGSLVADGSLPENFGSGGVVISDPSGNNDSAYGIAIHDGFIYVVGSDRSPGASDAQWRIEKRNCSDGLLVDEIVVNFSVDNDIPYAIAVDSASMYVVGYDRIRGSSNKRGKGKKGSSIAQWRIEKRSLSDLSVLQGSVNSYATYDFETARGIAIGGGFMYVIGFDELGYFDTEWHIEKRYLSNLSRDTNFDSDGIIIEDYGYDDQPTAIAVDSSHMYIAGFSSEFGNGGDTEWRIEKRDLFNGSLLQATVKDIDSENNDRAFAIALDSSHIYVAGYSNSGFPDYLPDWRIVKRKLDGLSLDLEPLDLQDQPVTLDNDDEFRLKMLLHVGLEPLPLNYYQFKLQYAKNTNCGSVTTYEDITDQTPIAFKDNPLDFDGTAISAIGVDLEHSDHTIRNQTFEEANNFTNSVSKIYDGEDGKWDFSLYVNNADSGTYCLRIIEDNGTAEGLELDVYSEYPEVTVN